MTRLVYGNIFESFMSKEDAKKARALSGAIIKFRENLIEAGLSEKKANKVVRSIKISDLMGESK